MPKYVKRRASRRKSLKSSRRGRSSRKRASRVVSRTGPFPTRYLTKLRYSQINALSFGGAGQAYNYQFRLNSIFDPDLTGTGHQPLGHDEFAMLYNRYRVYGVSYTITLSNQEAKHVEICIAHRPNTNTTTYFDTIRESTSTKHRITLGEEGSGQANRSVRGYAGVAATRGVSRREVQTDDNYQAAFGQNPVFTPTLVIYLSNQNTNETASVNMRVDLVYHVEVFDRKQLLQS